MWLNSFSMLETLKNLAYRINKGFTFKYYDGINNERKECNLQALLTSSETT
jgi:hypothetical protein